MKSSLLYKRAETTIHFYLPAKKVIKDRVVHLKNEGVKNVSIYGINHVSEVLFIVLKELGLELDYVVGDNMDIESWFGYKVIGMDDFIKTNAGVLILASFEKKQIDNFNKDQNRIRVVALRE